MQLESLLPRAVWQMTGVDARQEGEALLAELLQHLDSDHMFEFCAFLHWYEGALQEANEVKSAHTAATIYPRP